MLEGASNQPMLFLQHKNFRANGLSKLRKEIVSATLPKGTPLSLIENPPSSDSLPQLNIIRTSIFGVALRNFAPLDADSTQRIAELAGGGGLAVLSLPSLDPPQMNAILRALERAVPKKKAGADDASKRKGKDEDDGFVPGRRQKRQRPILTPELTLLGALIEGRVYAAQGVKDVAALPTLDTLRAQIVGLLQSPAVQLSMVLQEASGGRLARTLEGLKKGLEEGESTPVDAEKTA